MSQNEELAALQRGGKQASRALDPEVTAPDGSKVVPGSKRAFLEGRQGDLKIDDRVGKYEVRAAARGPAVRALRRLTACVDATTRW